jgi:hypothetical protein
MEKGMFYPRLLVVFASFWGGAVFLGCAHTHNVDSAFSWPEVQTDLPELEGKEVIVLLENGKQAHGYAQALKGDTLRLTDINLIGQAAIPYVDIHAIAVLNPGGGTAAFVGVVVGGIIGVVIGAQEPYTESSPFFGGLIGAIAGGAIATLVFPVKDTYIFQHQQADTLLVQVDRVLIEDHQQIKVRIGGQKHVLLKPECELLRTPAGVYVKGPRVMFIKLGVPVH